MNLIQHINGSCTCIKCKLCYNAEVLDYCPKCEFNSHYIRNAFDGFMKLSFNVIVIIPFCLLDLFISCLKFVKSDSHGFRNRNEWYNMLQEKPD